MGLAAVRLRPPACPPHRARSDAPHPLPAAGGIILPDSPNSLIERGHKEKGRQILCKIRGTEEVDAGAQHHSGSLSWAGTAPPGSCCLATGAPLPCGLAGGRWWLACAGLETKHSLERENSLESKQHTHGLLSNPRRVQRHFGGGPVCVPGGGAAGVEEPDQARVPVSVVGWVGQCGIVLGGVRQRDVGWGETA